MSVITIDCNYIEKEIAAAYLMIEGEEAAFIENNTLIPYHYYLRNWKEMGLKEKM